VAWWGFKRRGQQVKYTKLDGDDSAVQKNAIKNKSVSTTTNNSE